MNKNTQYVLMAIAGIILVVMSLSDIGEDSTDSPETIHPDTNSVTPEHFDYSNESVSQKDFNATDLQDGAIAFVIMRNGDPSFAEEDIELAKWFEREISNENPRAMFLLGLAYYYGVENVIDRDEELGIGWLERAAEFGDLEAKSQLDTIESIKAESQKAKLELTEQTLNSYERLSEKETKFLSQLIEIENDYPNSQGRIEMFSSAYQDYSNHFAPILLASTKLNLLGKSRQPTEYNRLLESYNFEYRSLDRLKAAADEESSTDAMYLLGVYYYQMAKYDKALKYLNQAQLADIPAAINMLAWMYRQGLGVELNMQQAFIYYKKAASLGYAPAMTNVASLYERGAGVEKSMIQAVGYIKKAAQLDSAAGLYMLAVYTNKGQGGIEKDLDKANSLFYKSAQLGHKRAMYVVGKRFQDGIGFQQDDSKARNWYRKAASLGDKDAEQALQNMY